MIHPSVGVKMRLAVGAAVLMAAWYRVIGMAPHTNIGNNFPLDKHLFLCYI
jgi:hypothetical protein